MRLEDYVRAVDANLAANPSWRYGQALFNTLYELEPAWAMEIHGSDTDPFYTNDRVPAFVVWLMDRCRLEGLRTAANGPKFLGIPERWLDDPHYRCTNNHVSRRILLMESGNRCLCCQSPVLMTVPEDSDGPLPADLPSTPGTDEEGKEPSPA